MSHLPQLPASPTPVSTRPHPSTGPRPDHLFTVILMTALYWTFDWGRVAPRVYSFRGWLEPDDEPTVSGAQCEVRLLGVEDEALVPQTSLAEALCGQEPRCPRRPLNRVGLSIRSRINHQFSPPATTREMAAQHRLAQRAMNAGRSPQRQRNISFEVAKPRNHDTHPPHQSLEHRPHRTGRHAHIRVEHENGCSDRTDGVQP